MNKPMFDNLIYVIDGQFILDAVTDHVDSLKDLRRGEAEFIQDYVRANYDVIRDDLQESIYNCIQHYFEDIRADFLADLEQSIKDQEAYDKWKASRLND